MRGLHQVFFPLVLAGPASAQISYPNCTAVNYEWSYNSLAQSPCNVAVLIQSACAGIDIKLPPLTPPAQVYYYNSKDSGYNTSCVCNTVIYSLYSACGGCQRATWMTWSMWESNCTPVSPLSIYPYRIPAGTSIPHWAYLDVTIADNWSAAAAQTAGDSPEVPRIPLSSSIGASSTVVYSPSSSTSLNQNKSHSGEIAGAVVGVLVGVLLVIGIIFWYLRRWRLRAAVQPASPIVHEALVNTPPIPVVINPPHTGTQPTPSAGHAAHTDSQPVRTSDGAARISEAFGIPDPNRSMAIGRYYDPLDPNTFPTPPVPLPMSGIQIAPNRRDGHNDPPSDSTRMPQYSGLPLV